MTESQQLLVEYARSGSDAAFREVVTRYVDLVYSTALRLLDGNRPLAEDVSQTVFLDLSRMIPTLSPDVMLGGWLHRHTCFVASKTLRGERRRQSRERQAVEMNALQDNKDFSHVAPLLDDAINELGDADRTAILLRFFEQKDFRSVGLALGSNEDAARMRVHRALEKLESLLKRRGVATSATVLSTVLVANAVQAAPVGLALSITTAAAIAGTAATATVATAAVKTITMTTLQKAIIGATLAAAVGTGVYEGRQASTLRTEVQTLKEEQAPLTQQIQALQQERDEATNKLVQLSAEVERLNRNSTELFKLRSEVARLRGQPEPPPETATTALNKSKSQTGGGDPTQLLQEGWQLMQSGRLAEAIPLFESAVKLDPKNSAAWNGLGWASFNSGKTAGAEKAFQNVIELEPEHPAALNGLGQLYLSQKKYAEAESYLLKAGPKAPAAWYGLTRLYLLQDRFEDAERWAQTIVDSGQGDETSRAMLKAAKDKKVSDGLRLMIEPK